MANEIYIPSFQLWEKNEKFCFQIIFKPAYIIFIEIYQCFHFPEIDYIVYAYGLINALKHKSI